MTRAARARPSCRTGEQRAATNIKRVEVCHKYLGRLGKEKAPSSEPQEAHHGLKPRYVALEVLHLSLHSPQPTRMILTFQIKLLLLLRIRQIK